MAKTVLATFSSRESADRAVAELRSRGFDREISVVAKEDVARNEQRAEAGPTMGGDPVADGTATGGVLGGLAGLIAGAGALAIPGIGPIVAAGPIAGLLSGAATGGIAGGLIDWGIPAERGRYYEEKVKQGNILVSVRCDDNKANDAATVLRQFGGQDVETH
ncbi:hypothetical protein SAMN02745218_02893 [Desulfofundulus australicus DSM 11792]|jgi:uncharacterized membrane protein|uniref:Heat induced stress protein YflT n=1 Tax=Desulfofundulus australicus DSM 11792 TaxID=1121425 RepID=A0A1M5DQX6_9FIRM|nr:MULTISPECIES: hypothetical protein [Desulfofundulus]MDK2887727.1 hypothetical protein [Thermoanaerobacter sp.]SHF69389.1 hypothetical protein SAMN02745218_02893 [Desulfofundulus australicus DSM 11792]